MNIEAILKQPEGRKIEFKETLPTKTELCKTVVAFANDAGGEIFVKKVNYKQQRTEDRKIVSATDYDRLRPITH